MYILTLYIYIYIYIIKDQHLSLVTDDLQFGFKEN